MLPKSMGGWVFLIGLSLAVILGLAAGAVAGEIGVFLGAVLVILGVIVALINITKKEVQGMMISALTLAVVTGVFALLPEVGGFVESLLGSIAIFAGAVALPLAVKTFYTSGVSK